MKIIAVRHDWPEQAGFQIHRAKGRKDYTFLHFSTPVFFEMEGKTVQAGSGACIFFAPGTPQHFYATEPVIHNWIHVDAELGQLLARYQIPVDQLLYPGGAEEISRLFHKIEVEFFSANAHREDLMEGYVKEFLIRFARNLEGESVPKGISRSDRQKLSAVRQQILSQPEKRWTVPQMAALAALSPSRFHAVYKAMFGTSPMQDVIEAKMRYARSLLLLNPDSKLPEIAECLGYNDQYHFLRLFKASVGMTPGAYRRKNNILEKE